jgi:hypothetical protein
MRSYIPQPFAPYLPIQAKEAIEILFSGKPSR